MIYVFCVLSKDLIYLLLFVQSSNSVNEDVGLNSAGDSSYYTQSTSTTAGTATISSAGEKKDEKSNKDKSAAAARAQAASGGTGWLGGFFNKFKPKTQMKLPDDKNPTVLIFFFVSLLSYFYFIWFN